jgi:hypothetical protein
MTNNVVRLIPIVGMTKDGMTEQVGMTAVEVDPVNDKLWAEHDAEAERLGVEFYNYGWGQGGHHVQSKTSRGYLSSNIDPTTLEVTHYFDLYDKYKRRASDPVALTVLAAHEAEAERLDLMILNLGCGLYDLCSKAIRRRACEDVYLTSKIDPTTLKVTHYLS